MKKLATFLGTASLALTLPAAPAHAGGAITNFTVKNCGSERIFVCSFDKTDGSLKIPYKAGGVQPKDKKEFGCASLKKCKVIIGVSKRKTKNTLSSGMEAAISAGAAGAVAIAGVTGAGASAVAAGGVGGVVITYSGATVTTTAVASSTVAALTAATVAAGVVAVVAGGSVAILEILDGWSDGEVCNQVRRAAQKVGMKPKSFMKNGKSYQVIEQYATDKSGNYYVNPDGTAVMAYVAKQGKDKDSCPAALQQQLVKD